MRSGCFRFFSQSSKTFVSNFLSSDNAVQPKRFWHTFVIFESNFALKDVYISSGPSVVYHSQTAKKTLSRDFLEISLLFTWFSSSKSSFSWPFAWNWPTRFKNIRIYKSFYNIMRLSVLSTQFGTKYPIRKIRIFFFIWISIRIVFHPDTVQSQISSGTYFRTFILLKKVLNFILYEKFLFALRPSNFNVILSWSRRKYEN